MYFAGAVWSVDVVAPASTGGALPKGESIETVGAKEEKGNCCGGGLRSVGFGRVACFQLESRPLM
jgi:hypothetical protein